MKNIEELLKSPSKKIEEKYLSSMNTPFINHLKDYIIKTNISFKILFENNYINDSFINDISFIVNTSNINFNELNYKELIKKIAITYISYIKIKKTEFYLSALKQTNDNYNNTEDEFPLNKAVRYAKMERLMKEKK